MEVAKLEAIREQLVEFYPKVKEEDSRKRIESVVTGCDSQLATCKARQAEAIASAQGTTEIPSNMFALIDESKKRQFKYDTAFNQCLAAITQYETDGYMDNTIWGAINSAVKTVGTASMGIGFLIVVVLIAVIFLRS